MQTQQPERRRIVVDGSNIATEGRSLPSLAQLDEAIRTFLEEYRGFTTADVTVVVDASFGHRIDPSEVHAFEQAIEHGEMITPPAGAVGRGDGFILRIAEKSGALVLSNDSFQEFHAERPWLFEAGRLIGGKPVPGVGWIFTPRTPVRGAKSRSVTSKSKRDAKAADADLAETGEQDEEATTPAAGRRTRGRRSSKAAAPTLAADVIESADDDAVDAGPDDGADGGAGSPSKRAAKATKSSGKATKAAKAGKTAGATRAAKSTKTAKAAEAAEAADAEGPDTATKATKRVTKAKATKATKAAAAVSGEQQDERTGPTKATKATKRTRATKGSGADDAIPTEVAGVASKAGRSAKAAKSTAKDPRTKSAGASLSTPGAAPAAPAAPAPPVAPAAPAGEALNDALTFLTFVADHPIGSTFDGTVVSFTSHGAHVDVGGMLCHIPLRNLGDPPPNKARQVLTKGEIRPFVLVSLDAPRRRAELTLP
jgi:hypothetical protein